MDLPESFKSKTYIEVWYSDLGEFASKHFNCDFRMADVLDYPSQDTYHTITVPTDRDWEDVWNEELVTYEINPNRGAEIRAELAEGNAGSLSLDSMMDLMYDDGIIPAGEYLITVWW